MINVGLPTLARRKQATIAARRIGSRTFWTLFVVEALVVVGILLLVLHLMLPTRTPLADAPNVAVVREAIWSRVNGVVDDPQIVVAPGVTAPSSSVRGFSFKGETYYYYFEGRPRFDPLSRGVLDESEVEMVLRDSKGPAPLVIYRLISKDRATV